MPFWNKEQKQKEKRAQDLRGFIRVNQKCLPEMLKLSPEQIAGMDLERLEAHTKWLRDDPDMCAKYHEKERIFREAERLHGLIQRINELSPEEKDRLHQDFAKNERDMERVTGKQIQ